MAVGRVEKQWDPSQDDRTRLSQHFKGSVSIQGLSCIDTEWFTWEQKARVSIQDFSCIDTECHIIDRLTLLRILTSVGIINTPFLGTSRVPRIFLRVLFFKF